MRGLRGRRVGKPLERPALFRGERAEGKALRSRRARHAREGESQKKGPQAAPKFTAHVSKLYRSRSAFQGTGRILPGSWKAPTVGWGQVGP